MILHASEQSLSARVPQTVGTVEAIDEERCLLHTGADWLGGLAVDVASIPVDFEVVEPPELIDQIRVLADRFRRAAVDPR